MSSDEAVNRGPEPVTVGVPPRFKIKVSFDNQQLGWWKNTSWGNLWIVTGEEKDAIVWEQIVEGGQDFWKKATNNYLGLDGNYLAIQDWWRCSAWRLEGNRLRSLKTDKLVGVQGDPKYFNAVAVNVVSLDVVSVPPEPDT